MNVFDPTKGMNAFAQGAQIGGNIRKGQTQRALAPMIASNDYEGAMKYAASRGDMSAMDYLRPMQEKAQSEAYNKQLGGMLASGDTKGAIGNAFAAGKLDQGMQLQQYARAMRADEITDYKTGLEFLDSNADDVMKNFTPEQRKDEYIRRVAASPYGQDPQIMATLERAGADGVITDDEVLRFRSELMSAGERLAQQNWETEQKFKGRVQGFNEMNADRGYDLQKDQFGLEQNRFGWQQGTDVRDFTEGVRQFDASLGLKRQKLEAEAAADGRPEKPSNEKGYQTWWDDEAGTWRQEIVPGGSVDKEMREAEATRQRVMNRSFDTIESLINHPSFDSAYGLSSKLPVWPGGERAEVEALIDQISGQAFLEAFENLKGGGQITEIEGKKATDAITRLQNRNLSPDAARQAAQDLMEVIDPERAASRSGAEGWSDDDERRLQELEAKRRGR